MISISLIVYAGETGIIKLKMTHKNQFQSRCKHLRDYKHSFPVKFIHKLVILVMRMLQQPSFGQLNKESIKEKFGITMNLQSGLLTNIHKAIKVVVQEKY